MTRTSGPCCAAVDVGSHSAKLTLAEATAGGWRPLLERVEITGLGRGEARRDGLDPAGRRATLAVLSDFARLIAERGASGVAAAGTGVLRHAPDAGSFILEARELTGLPLELISGMEEARLTYLGAVATLPPAPAGGWQLVFDIGGASTELAWGRAREPDDRRSLEVGTIALAGRHGLAGRVGSDRMEAARAEVDRQLAVLPSLRQATRLVGIGATPTTLLALDRGRDLADSAAVHGQLLERRVVTAQIARLRTLEAAQRRELPGLHPGRAEVVLAGAVITAAVAARWPGVPLVLSGRGLRSGLLFDRFGDGT